MSMIRAEVSPTLVALPAGAWIEIAFRAYRNLRARSRTPHGVRGSRSWSIIFQKPLTNDGASHVLSMPDEFLTGYPLCGIGVRIRAIRTFLFFQEDAVPRMALFRVDSSIPSRRGDVSRGAFQGRPAPRTHPGITPPSVSGVGAPVAGRKHKKNDRPQYGRSNAKPHSHDSPQGAQFQRYSYFARSDRRCSRLWAFYPPTR